MEPFHSPEEVYQLINWLIHGLQQIGLDASPLKNIQSKAFTTNSEWYGELKEALQRVGLQTIPDPELNAAIARLKKEVCRRWR